MTAAELRILAFRKRTGCRQYPFASFADFKAWASRRPYSQEILWCYLVEDCHMKDTAPRDLTAPQLVDWVEKRISA